VIELDGRKVFEDHNLLTNAGLAQIASLLISGSTLPFNYIALGTGTTPADVSDTALEAEKVTDGVPRKVANSGALTTTTVTNDTAQLIAIFNAPGGFSLSELGLFTAISSGVLGARRVFSPISVLNLQTITVTWTLTVVAG
jgi:hypothetical protein